MIFLKPNVSIKTKEATKWVLSLMQFKQMHYHVSV
jgi:hypothetical protein